MNALEILDVRRSYGATIAVAGVTFNVTEGQFVALVGASGSGKTTLLKTINRLVDIDSGTIRLFGEDIARLPPHQLRRRIGYVFQGVGLFPHLDVTANIGTTPRLLGTPPALIVEQVDHLLDLVRLPRAYARRLPSELSGGERQRVGLARALAAEPRLLLMDEPMGALDPVTRDALGEAVRALHDRLGLTTIMVTHDMAEALLLADRVLVFAAGRIVADETPARLMAGNGGDIAQSLVAVPRRQAERMAQLGSRT